MPETIDLQSHRFIPTPERISETLGNRQVAEIAVQLKSIEGRKKLAEDLRVHADEIRQKFPDFSPDALEHELDVAGETLLAFERLQKEADSPERKGVLRRAFDTIKSFPFNHPYITTILLIALLTAGAGYLGYLPSLNFGGWWNSMKGWLGIGEGSGAVEALEEGVGGMGTTIQDVTPALNDAVNIAPEASKVFDVLVNKDGYLFNGVQYAKDELTTLIDTMRAQGMDAAEYIKVLQADDSKIKTSVDLFDALHSYGIDSDRILSPDFTATSRALIQPAKNFFEIIVNGDGYLFDGTQYGVNDLQKLHSVLSDAGVESAGNIVIKQTKDAKYLPFQDLYDSLKGIGIEEDRLFAPTKTIPSSQ